MPPTLPTSKNAGASAGVFYERINLQGLCHDMP